MNIISYGTILYHCSQNSRMKFAISTYFNRFGTREIRTRVDLNRRQHQTNYDCFCLSFPAYHRRKPIQNVTNDFLFHYQQFPIDFVRFPLGNRRKMTINDRDRNLIMKYIAFVRNRNLRFFVLFTWNMEMTLVCNNLDDNTDLIPGRFLWISRFTASKWRE